MTNKRKEAAKAAGELREMMREIIAVSGEEDEEVEAARHASAALDGIEDAERAMWLWRDLDGLGEVHEINWPDGWTDRECVEHIAGQIRQPRSTEWIATRAGVDVDVAHEYLEKMDEMEDGWNRTRK